MCVCTTILAGWVAIRFEDVSWKESAPRPAEPPAATGLDQVIAVLGKKPYEDLVAETRGLLEDHR